MKISDHQPFLFGHAGYWSKIASSDLHIVMADVRYRPEDKLTTCRLSDTVSFAASVVSSKENPSIGDMVLVKTKKLRASVEQQLMNKSMPYRDRLGPLLPVLQDGQPYLAAWISMARIVAQHARIPTRMVYSEVPPTGATPFARNLNRVARLVPSPDGCEYLCGPAVENYVTRNDECPMPILLHTMPKPSPLSFVRSIVEQLDPILPEPTIRVLSL